MLRNRRSSSQDGGVGRNPSLPCTNKRRIITNLKSINKQKSQKIKLQGTLTTKKSKKKINQNNQSSKAADHTVWLRKTGVTRQTLGVGLAAELSGMCGRDWLKGTQRWLWAMEVAVVGEAPSLTQESIEKCARDEQSVPSLDLPPQAAQQGRKEGLPAWVNN